MRWKLSEEQDAYRQSFGAWLADVAPREVVRRWLDDGDAGEFAGWLGAATDGPGSACRRLSAVRAAGSSSWP